MEQERIGKFIQNLRKENNLTQKELAEKLGVTDRAISKWENGRGMPDVSLMKPLCDILGITVSELLSGERIDKKDYQEKSEFAFLSTIHYADTEAKKKNILKRILWTAGILLLIFAYVMVYLLPTTQGYFREGEQVEIHYIIKTTLHVPEGQVVERYSNVDYTQEEIHESIDLEKFAMFLPMMRISLYKEFQGSHWVGDVVYEIDGHFTSGLRKGKFFHILLGIPEESHLRTRSNQWSYIIYDSDAWLDILAMLEHEAKAE